MDKREEYSVSENFAAVCGLYCGACSLFIATTEDPERLKNLASRFGLPEEEMRCLGCRSEKRPTPCANCHMFRCAAEKGLKFCGECSEYPCEELKKFQADRPHRADLWRDQERIKAAGCGQWLREIPERYACPSCGVVNSAYDLRCRGCGAEPSCAFVDEHGQRVVQYLAKMR